jgi:hypothetical protein
VARVLRQRRYVHEIRRARSLGGGSRHEEERLSILEKDAMNNVLAVLAGGFFVLVYAWHRFRNPSVNRSSTTAIRYYAAAVSYCLWSLALYALILAALTFSPDVAKTVSAAFATELYKLIVELRDQGVSYPLVVALLLTTLLPNIPVIAQADRRVREQLEHMAAIPYEVRRLTAALARSEFPLSGVAFGVSRSSQERVRQRLLEQDFRREDIIFNSGPDLRTLWTRVTVLIVHVEDWRSERKLAAFCESCMEGPDEIARVYEDLLPRVRRCFLALRASALDRDNETRGAIAEYRVELDRQVRQLLQRLYRFVSAATLQCELTQKDRVQRLARLGFHFRPSWQPSPLLMTHRLATRVWAVCNGSGDLRSCGVLGNFLEDSLDSNSEWT